MIKKVPNLLCLFRIVLIPFILLFMIENPITAGILPKTRLLISGILFGVAILTDAFDGKIARKYDAVTNFGKFVDPIADKMLVLSILTAFVEINVLSSIPVILTLSREFLVTGLRLGAMGKGKVVSANIWGKIKTAFQGISIGVMFVFLAFLPETITIGEAVVESLLIPQILLWISAIYAAISAIPYAISMAPYIKD